MAATVTDPVAEVKKTTQNKVQNKIVHFMEESGGYKSKREEFIALNK